MRRWLAILLLVLLPLQVSWAAVANYCMDGSSPAADHLGHHDHAAHGHELLADGGGDQADADGASPTSATLDCGHCHGHAAALVDAFSRPQPHGAGNPPPSLGDAPCADPVPAQPDRPQWACIA